MTRRSWRELERAIEELESDAGAEEYDRDPLTPAEKEALAELFDRDPWERNDDDADLEVLKQMADDLF